MKSTFNLKKSNKSNLSLILFSAYFKEEDRKLVYSTGELINPNEWDKVNKQPNNLNGRTKEAENHRTINTQIKRYSAFFNDTIAKYKLAQREITIAEVRSEFDKEFKKTSGISNKFFQVYDKYVNEKKNDYSDEAVSITTIRRFKYNKKILIELEEKRKKKISFNQINKTFYNEFLKFCIEEKRHSSNTLRRNVGLLKTFLYWSLENNHTYKVDFQKFKAPKAQPTDEIALTQSDIDKVFEFDLSKNIKLERVRDLFILGCSTGLRISNYSKIRKQDIVNDSIQVRDEKNKDKSLSIPLNDYSKYILEKYNFQLPKISTQKFNVYIKDVFKIIGFDTPIKKELKIGKEIIETISPMYERISSHTARRSFITVMKNNKVPDKLIMKITGHKNLEVFNKYYKPNEVDKADAMKTVWKRTNAPLAITK